jgi:uncharacterized protein
VPASKLAVLVSVFFVTSVISVVTGSTSLITVPVMIAVGLLPVTILLTVVGSTIGALLLVRVPVRTLQLTIAVAMIAVAIFSLIHRESGITEHPVSNRGRAFGYVSTFILAVYGGFFSGGYVTILTAIFVFFFGLTLLQSVAATKVLNIFSSAVATIIFAWHGVLDYKLGLILGVTMFLGALAGGNIAIRLSSGWLRRIFLFAVIVLAAKMLFISPA